MKSIVYFVISTFVLTHICFLSSSIAECGIEDIDAANAELDRLYDERDKAERKKDAAAAAYSNYVDTIGTQYLVGMGVPGAIGLLGGPVGAGAGLLIGGTITTIKVGLEASNLYNKYVEAREAYESLDRQVRELEDNIVLYYTTHDDDDQDDNNQNQNNNDDGCNDS